MAATPGLAAQERPVAPDTARELMLEIRFSRGSVDTGSVRLERGIVYWAEISGPGTPVFQPQGGRPLPPLVVPLERAEGAPARAYEVHAYQARPHLVTVTDLSSAASGVLRLYRDAARTRGIAERRDRRVATGLLAAGGFHTGYRLVPTGAADPAGGTDLEACLLVEAGGWWGGCIGVGRQSMPDARYFVWWMFLEGRARLLTGQLLGDHRTDVGVALRLSQGLDAGPRSLDPVMLALGLYVTQHLAAGGRRRGWSVFGAWYHGRLGNTVETELLDTDRFTAGVIWIP
jgi:hypothetical protein